ncbi:MAG: prephenate dehydratase [Rhodospirillaceae bacterium]
MSFVYPAGTVFAFQGSPGAYSDLACHGVCAEPRTVPCASFEDTFAAVHEGVARYAMIPVENSVAGRVADIHHLLPDGGLTIVGEHFQRVNHHLLALPGTTLADLRSVRSHIQALSQCRETLRRLGLKPVSHADTAGAAAEVAALGDRSVAAIASGLAAKTYRLATILEGIEDHEHNTTRFVILARQPELAANDGRALITSLVFRVRSVPAALFKALGGFATNSVNITKLESYLVGGRFSAAQFYADVDGHPDDKSMRHALEELRFFVERCETGEDAAFFAGCDERLNPAGQRDAMVKIIGVYPAHPFRRNPSQIGDD